MRRSGTFVATACAALMLDGSGCITQTYSQNIAVQGGATLEEKVRRVSTLATPERLARLKTELKQRMPGVTDSELQGLALSWRQVTIQSLTGKGRTEVVTLIISVAHDGSIDPAPIVREAAAILEPELNGPAMQGTPSGIAR